MLTNIALYSVPLPGLDMLACHNMLEPVVDPHWIDHDC